MSNISQTAKSILVLLNNINDLIVVSSDRKNAKDVMKALTVYASSKKFDLPEDQIDTFHAVLLDSTPLTLTTIIKDIANHVISYDQKSNSRKK